MGNFYVNYTLKGPGQQEVAKALTGRRSIVTPSQKECIVVYDEESDEQNTDIIAKLASKLSKEFKCPLLAILNHDDDILWYQLYTSGKLIDEYDSTPGYFDPKAKPSGPAGGDAQKLCDAFGVNDVISMEGILRKSGFDEDGYVFAFLRHADIVRVLDLPEFGVGTAYASFDRDECPEGLTPDNLIMTE
jgi:hypothetical protein